MKYIIVNDAEAAKKFPFASKLKDGRIILPCNYIKVLNNVSVDVVDEGKAINLLHGDNNDGEATETAEEEK